MILFSFTIGKAHDVNTCKAATLRVVGHSCETPVRLFLAGVKNWFERLPRTMSADLRTFHLESKAALPAKRLKNCF